MSTVSAISAPPSAVKWAWKALDCIRGAFDLITYIFFRVLSFFKPSFSEKAQKIWTHANLIWYRLKSDWYEKQLKEGPKELLSQNQNLTKQVRQFLTEKRQVEQQRDEKIAHNLDLLHQNDQLTAKSEALKKELAAAEKISCFANRELQIARNQFANFARQVRAEQNKSAHSEESTQKLEGRCDTLIGEIQSLQEKLADSETKLKNGQDFHPLFEQWSRQQETISMHLSRLAESCNAQKDSANQSNVDHEVQQLTSLFHQEEINALAAFDKEIQSLPPDNPTRVRLEIFGTIARCRKLFFETAARTIGLHSSTALELASLSKSASFLADATNTLTNLLQPQTEAPHGSNSN